ncbi:MAG: endonuclease NucS domain-containing protein [Candidatus Promineifilaceae bacterium]
MAGTVIGVVGAIALGVLLDYILGRREKASQQQKHQPITLDSILEAQLESFIVDNFVTLFPGWKIFDEPNQNKSGDNGRPSGIQYHTSAGKIDILAIDPQDALVTIELKRDKAPDKVVSQVDRYMAWVKAHLAKPGQRVRGLIIAKSADDRLVYSLSRRRGINIWRYEYGN